MNEKVMIIGCGNAGRAHALAYELVGCRVRYVYDTDMDAALELGDQMSVNTSVAGDLELMEEVDIVSIATPDQTHCSYVIAALANGKHVWCEKPVLTQEKWLNTLKVDWKTSGKLLGCNFPLPVTPAYRYLLENLHGLQDLGTIYSIDAEYCYGRLGKLTGDGWRNDSNYSTMLGGGIHMIDLMLLVAKFSRPYSVYALSRSQCLDEQFTEGHLSSAVPNDYVTATFQFGSELVARVTANFGSVTPHHHRLAVYGTKGTAIIDDAGFRMCFERDSPHTAFTPSTLSTKPETGALIPHFVRAVRGETEWTQTQRIFDGLSIAFACEESLKQGREVKINYV